MVYARCKGVKNQKEDRTLGGQMAKNFVCVCVCTGVKKRVRERKRVARD